MSSFKAKAKAKAKTAQASGEGGPGAGAAPVAAEAAESTASKTLQLAPERVALLLGPEGLNVLVLEQACQVSVEVLNEPAAAEQAPMTAAAAAPTETEAPTSAEAATGAAAAIAGTVAAEGVGETEGEGEAEADNKLSVVLTTLAADDFGDKAFARKVHRYVKSASRGGFITFFKRIKFEHNDNQGQRAKVRNCIDRLKKDFASVEVVLQRLDMHWALPADATTSTADEVPLGPARFLSAEGDEDRTARVPSLCLCVLPGTTAAAVGPTAEAELDTAIALMRRASSCGWKMGSSERKMQEDLQALALAREAHAAPKPQSLQDKKDFRKLNTTQRNKEKGKG